MSRRGKPVFFLLLIVVCVSFVLYLSQGTSVFDFMSDPNRETKDFYGTDLNDPQERRVLALTNQVAADLGVVISPTREILQKADVRYFESLQNQIRAAYQPENRDKVDQNALQEMFGYMQSWQTFPDAVKLTAIARSGNYDYEFSESSIRAKIIMDSLADQFGLLPLELDHPKINSLYHDFLNRFNPTLADEQNRSQVFGGIGKFRGLGVLEVDDIMFSHYRAHQIDQVFLRTGYTLDAEGSIDFHRDQFAWDAEAISLSDEDFSFVDPVLASFAIKEQPLPGQKVSIDMGGKNAVFEFSEDVKEANGTQRFVKIGPNAKSTLVALSEEVSAANLGLSSKIQDQILNLVADLSALPRNLPSFSSTSDSLKPEFSLKESLLEFHEEVKEDELFEEPARTYASVISFESKDFYTPLPEPDEARMRSYFERNKVLFEPIPEPPSPVAPVQDKGAEGPEGEKGPSDGNASRSVDELNILSSLKEDQNQSNPPEVTFEEVKDEVRQRIMESDKLASEKDADDLAKESALVFLDRMNGTSDKLRLNYPAYPEMRNSAELKDLIQSSGGKLKRISFSSKERKTQSGVLGLETRESERRSNRDPLVEVESLNEKFFFTRSIRKTRFGYAVFILDRKSKASPGQFETVHFRNLYSEYLKKIKAKAFGLWVDQQFTRLTSDDSNFTVGQKISIERKSPNAVRGSFDFKNEILQNQIRQLQDERNNIATLERESNQTERQPERKKEIDRGIEELRESQAELNQRRMLASQLLGIVGTLEPNGQWVEQEKTASSALFVRLAGVYTLRSKITEPELIKNRVNALEFSRAENARSLLLGDMIASGLAD